MYGDVYVINYAFYIMLLYIIHEVPFIESGLYISPNTSISKVGLLCPINKLHHNVYI